MSGYSDTVECPNCNKSCDRYSETKPFDYVSHWCLNCGLEIVPVIQYLSLKELNIRRGENEPSLPKLKKKPKQNKDIW